MKLKDYERLKKLMMLTQSTNDHEALSALRSANEILVAYGIDWNRVFSRTIQVVMEVERGPDDNGYIKEVEDLFDVATARNTTPFISSLQEQWLSKQWLSEKQLAALRKFVDSQR